MDVGVERAANAAGRERPARSVRPGWWVYSFGPDRFGHWSPVVRVTQFRDASSGAAMVRFELPADRGRACSIETAAGASAFCLSASVAGRVGLTGTGSAGFGGR